MNAFPGGSGSSFQVKTEFPEASGVSETGDSELVDHTPKSVDHSGTSVALSAPRRRVTEKWPPLASVAVGLASEYSKRLWPGSREMESVVPGLPFDPALGLHEEGLAGSAGLVSTMLRP